MDPRIEILVDILQRHRSALKESYERIPPQLRERKPSDDVWSAALFAVGSRAMRSTAVRSTAVGSTAVRSTAVRSTAVGSTAVGSTAVRSTAVRSTAVRSTVVLEPRTNRTTYK